MSDSEFYEKAMNQQDKKYDELLKKCETWKLVAEHNKSIADDLREDIVKSRSETIVAINQHAKTITELNEYKDIIKDAIDDAKNIYDPDWLDVTGTTVNDWYIRAKQKLGL